MTLDELEVAAKNCETDIDFCLIGNHKDGIKDYWKGWDDCKKYMEQGQKLRKVEEVEVLDPDEDLFNDLCCAVELLEKALQEMEKVKRPPGDFAIVMEEVASFLEEVKDEFADSEEEST